VRKSLLRVIEKVNWLRVIGKEGEFCILYFYPCISDFTDKKGAFTEKNEVYDITGLIL
jgi:hypothetical protein